MPGGGTAIGTKISSAAFAAQAFAARLTTPHPVMGGNVAVIVPLDAEELDTQGWYTPGAATFQPNVPGMYLVTAQLTLTSFTGVLTASLTRSGSEAARSSVYSNGGTATASLSALVPMNGTSDTLTFKVAHSDTVLRTVTSASMAGILMGRL